MARRLGCRRRPGLVLTIICAAEMPWSARRWKTCEALRVSTASWEIRLTSASKIWTRRSSAISKKFETAAGKFDLYIPFLEQGTALLRKDGLLGMIVPNKFLTADYGAAFRGFAARHRLLRQLVDFESRAAFSPARARIAASSFSAAARRTRSRVSRGSVERPIARETAVVPSDTVRRGPVERQAEEQPRSTEAGCPSRRPAGRFFRD